MTQPAGQRHMEVQKGLAAERKSRAAVASNQRRSGTNPEVETLPPPADCGKSRDKVGEMVGVSACAAECMEVFAAEAKKRQRLGKENLPDPSCAGQASDQAGEMFGVSGRSVRDAHYVMKNDPEAFGRLSAAWEVDAQQTGEIDRNRKPYLAMRAARCVEVFAHGGDRRTSSAKLILKEKCSSPDFARVSGIASNTVLSYIALYDRCVSLFGLVPRDEMVPLHDYPFPTDEQWVMSA